ncbi:MAG TPA: 50S ribosomal protein L15e, partial [Candidatus Acidoferrum sp.]|nr:50S ribosomal protein L15e [Candidatus Acidoferrum sp.]
MRATRCKDLDLQTGQPLSSSFLCGGNPYRQYMKAKSWREGMGAYKYMSKAWNERDSSVLGQYLRQAAISWRRDSVIKRLQFPTRLDRARSVGYRKKQGFVVARVRVRKGGARKKRPSSGRRPRALGVTKFTRAKSLKEIAEERVAKKFPNLSVLNSYYVWEDGTSKWFEVVLVD